MSQRLEQVFQMHGADVKAVDCPAIDGIIEEADEVAGEVEDKSVLDAALINAAQAAEHYEIVRYGSLIAWAKQLGRNDCASVLQKTLDEEKATDKKLTTLAEEQDQSSRRELIGSRRLRQNVARETLSRDVCAWPAAASACIHPSIPHRSVCVETEALWLALVRRNWR